MIFSQREHHTKNRYKVFEKENLAKTKAQEATSTSATSLAFLWIVRSLKQRSLYMTKNFLVDVMVAKVQDKL